MTERFLLRLLILALCAFGGSFFARAAVLKTPLMQGQDPSIEVKDGVIHLVQSDGCAIHLRRGTNFSALRLATDTVILNVGCSNVWAPELHFFDGHWYLYYSFDAGAGEHGYVAESRGTNVGGPYTQRGMIWGAYWNIDGNAFRAPDGTLYYTFSGMPNVDQVICIAPMSNPYTLASAPVTISTPSNGWERNGAPPNVNEGPWGFTRNGKVFIVYSASGCWTDDYALGLLTLTGSDPLNQASWTKTGPVFSKIPTVYGPGHNAVVQTADGEWWQMFHANSSVNQGCGGGRLLRAQRIAWDSAGAPVFGAPTPLNSLTPEDSDQLAASYPLNETSGTVAHEVSCVTTAQLKAAPVWLGPGIHFGGAGDYVDGGATIGNHVQFGLTLMTWVKAEAFSDGAGLIVKGTTNSPYALQVLTDGSVRFTMNRGVVNGGTGAAAWTNAMKLELGRWRHVAVSYDGASVRFFVNGILNSAVDAKDLRFGVVNEPLTLGADLVGGAKYFSGAMRDARVYGRGLNQSEIATIVSKSAVVAAQRSGDAEFTLSWPVEQLGWRLLHSADSANWQPVADSETTNNFALPISFDAAADFFKLVYP